MRPKKCRRVDLAPNATVYKPAGVPLYAMQTVEIGLDELEAVRLADAEGLYQTDACARMNVSRSTFARLLDAAHAKIAHALLNGKAIVIQTTAEHIERHT